MVFNQWLMMRLFDEMFYLMMRLFDEMFYLMMRLFDEMFYLMMRLFDEMFYFAMHFILIHLKLYSYPLPNHFQPLLSIDFKF
ncbi:hypothetical protein TH0179_15160 [Helicobacter pylori]